MPAAVDVRDSDSDVAEIVGVVELVDSVQTDITRFFQSARFDSEGFVSSYFFKK